MNQICSCSHVSRPCPDRVFPRHQSRSTRPSRRHKMFPAVWNCPKCKTPTHNVDGRKHVKRPGCESRLYWETPAAFHKQHAYNHYLADHGSFDDEGIVLSDLTPEAVHSIGSSIIQARQTRPLSCYYTAPPFQRTAQLKIIASPHSLPSTTAL